MKINSAPLLMLLPLVAALMLAEALYLIGVRKQQYNWRETLASTAVAVGHRVSELVTTGLLSDALAGLWQHRLFTLDFQRKWHYLLLFTGVEFLYYWYHRASHRCNWMWATHAVHHSPRYMNLSAAYRLGWTGPISGALIFFAPLVWLGFSPKAVFSMLAINLLYQFWLHTEVISRLGFLDKILNTPSNHRVHHGTNSRYIDTNFGGVLIIFDRIFGTYVAESADEPIRYGLVHTVDAGVAPSNNPLRIVFGEWIAMASNVTHSRSVREVIGFLFGPPGWQPDRPMTIRSEKIFTADNTVTLSP